MSGRIFVQTFLCRLTFQMSVSFPWLSHNCTHISLMFQQHTNNFWSGRSCRFFLTLSYTEGGGGGAESARANFKDSYLCNEYCYSNEIWRLFIKFIGKDNGALIIPVPIKPLPWQPLFQNPLLTILTRNLLKCIFISDFPIEMLNLNRLETFSMFLINFWLILSSF